jgi:hypothetical protein
VLRGLTADLSEAKEPGSEERTSTCSSIAQHCWRSRQPKLRSSPPSFCHIQPAIVLGEDLGIRLGTEAIGLLPQRQPDWPNEQAPSPQDKWQSRSVRPLSPHWSRPVGAFAGRVGHPNPAQAVSTLPARQSALYPYR